jgi:1-phosphatidylinositol-3-phosphate 5-kinase
MIEEETIPIFSAIPEFEEIAKSKKFICFEEKYILKDSNKYEIIVYYPKQFEALRIAYCSTTENFLKSLSKSFEWTENSGGKSKAGFYKTFDNKFILKNVSETEFEMFLDNALEYFKYVSKFLFHKMPSILAKILGAYKITTQHKNKEVKYNLILMENLFYGMMTKNNATFNSRDSSLKVYDLKGSNINRYITKNNRRPGQVLLDTNFLVDFNKEPVNIDSYVYSKLNLALLNDSEYLKKSGVVDYSLLIIFDSEGSEKQKLEEVGDNVYYDYETNNFFSEKEKSHCLIKLGIIDYIRKYTWDKKMEFYGKSIIYRDNPTIVDPNVYRDRFYKAISRYFVGV